MIYNLQAQSSLLDNNRKYLYLTKETKKKLRIVMASKLKSTNNKAAC